MNGLGRTVSKQAMYELKSARSRDEAACSAVFEALEIHGNKHRKLRSKILKAYSNVVSGGTGHIKQLYEEWEVERNSREYMKRTFCCLDPGSSRFTGPMFVLCLWNFMTLENGGLRGPPVKKAEWIGRAYFGGNRCILPLRRRRTKCFVSWMRQWACLKISITTRGLRIIEI